MEPLDDLDWNRLRSGNYRALDPDHQDVFDMFQGFNERIEALVGGLTRYAAHHHDCQWIWGQKYGDWNGVAKCTCGRDEFLVKHCTADSASDPALR